MALNKARVNITLEDGRFLVDIAGRPQSAAIGSTLYEACCASIALWLEALDFQTPDPFGGPRSLGPKSVLPEDNYEL